MKSLSLPILGLVAAVVGCSQISEGGDPELIPLYDDEGQFVINFADSTSDDRYADLPVLLDIVPVEQYSKLEKGETYEEACEIMGGGGSIGMVGVDSQGNR
jgi:hypothetical protein